MIDMLSGHTDQVNCLSVNPKDSTFVTCSADKTLKVWDLRQKNFVDSISASNSSPFWSCKFASDGKGVYTGSEDGYFTYFSA
jgi:WD40 repeat protein